MLSIKLQSSDGEIFKVDIEIAKQSVTIETTLEDLGMGDEGDDDPGLSRVVAGKSRFPLLLPGTLGNFPGMVYN